MITDFFHVKYVLLGKDTATIIPVSQDHAPVQSCFCFGANLLPEPVDSRRLGIRCPFIFRHGSGFGVTNGNFDRSHYCPDNHTIDGSIPLLRPNPTFIIIFTLSHYHYTRIDSHNSCDSNALCFVLNSPVVIELYVTKFASIPNLCFTKFIFLQKVLYYYILPFRVILTHLVSS